MKKSNQSIKISLFTLCVALLYSCGETESNNDGTTDESSESTSPSSCIADYIPENDIENMLTAAQFAAIVNQPEEGLEYSESKSSSAEYSTFGYEWEPENPRIMKMEMESGGRKISVDAPLKNQIDIGRVEVLEPKEGTPLEYFDFVYGPKSKEQKEAAKKAIDKAKADTDVDDDAAETVKSMVDKNNGGSRLDDVGDRAYWGEGNASGMVYVKLKVLDGDTVFEIVTDVSDDTQEDLRVAKEAANQIIANCN